MLSAADIDALAGAAHADPFSVLGMHEAGGKLYVRAVMPEAERVEVVEVSTGRALAALAAVHPAGVFDGRVPRRRNPFGYRLRVTWAGIPVLVDDGIVVWESMATTLYLARKFGGPLAPSNLAEEAEV